MAPKQMAVGLFAKMFEFTMNLNMVNSGKQRAIECALIAVEEIMKSNPIIPLQFMLESEALDAANEYWQEVKQEIENL